MSEASFRDPCTPDLEEEVERFVNHLRTFDGPPNPSDPLVEVIDGITYVRQDLEGGPLLRYRSRAEYERLVAQGRAMVDAYVADHTSSDFVDDGDFGTQRI